MIMPAVIGVREAKVKMGQILEEVQGGQIYEIVRHGKPVAILVGVENYTMLLERIEDMEDLLDAKEAIKEPSRPFEEFVSEYAARYKAGV